MRVARRKRGAPRSKRHRGSTEIRSWVFPLVGTVICESTHSLQRYKSSSSIGAALHGNANRCEVATRLNAELEIETWFPRLWSPRRIGPTAVAFISFVQYIVYGGESWRHNN